MRKHKYLLFIGFMVLALAGCGKKSQITDFIPTPMITQTPADGSGEVTDGSNAGTDQGTEGDATATPTDRPIVVGKTTAKYVKLGEYDAILNVRSEPSKEGTIVGFLVHTEKVDVMSIENGWAKFVVNGKACYVSADFLADERPAYITPPTPTPSVAPTPTLKPSQN